MEDNDDIEENQGLTHKAPMNGQRYDIINNNDDADLEDYQSLQSQRENKIRADNAQLIDMNKFLKEQKGKTKIMLNLCLVLCITLCCTLFFILTIGKKGNQKKDFLPGEDTKNMPNEVSLIHSEKGLYCPLPYSFSPIQLKCQKCSTGCNACIPGIGGTNPCTTCQRSYFLLGDKCQKSCPHGYGAWEGLCVLDQEKNFEQGTLKLNDIVQAELNYIIYTPKYEYNKVLVLLPPIGNNHVYFSGMADLSLFAQLTGCAIIVVSTPVEQVAKINEPKSSGQQYNIDHTEKELFPYIENISENIIKTFATERVKEFYYVGLGDSLFLTHQLSHYIIRNHICIDCYHTIILFQTQITKLQGTLRLDQVELGIVLGYLDGQFDLKHQDKENFTHISNITNNSAIENSANLVIQMIEAAQDFKTQFKIDAMYKPAYNKELEIILLNEKGVESTRTVSNLKGNKPFRVELLDLEIEPTLDDYQVPLFFLLFFLEIILSDQRCLI